MSWISKDIEDLVELQEGYCSETDCNDCEFNIGRTKPCLEDIAKSMKYTLSQIEKAKRRLEEYV